MSDDILPVLSELPTELVCLILSNLELYDLSDTARVCKRWKNVLSIAWVLDKLMAETKQNILDGVSGGFVISHPKLCPPCVEIANRCIP